jgi:predicted lipid-binding transport protein (Tim44 family)
VRLRLVGDLAGRPGRRSAVKDGAHTHRHGGGLAVAVVIGAGAMLAIGVAEAIAKVLPYVLTGVAVIAGLWAAGWIIRAVLAYRSEQAAWHAEVTGASHDGLRDREIAALRQAVDDLHARLAARPESWERPGLERHEHVHFHGLAAEQVAAVLTARQHARPQDRGGEW